MSPDRLADYFSSRFVGPKIDPSWNVAPTDDVYVVYTPERERVLDTLRWGLVPWWAKSLKEKPSPFNIRAETIAKKRNFKEGFESRRCILPADGFYEWREKQAHFIRQKSEEPLALAGIWGRWRDPASKDVTNTCSIITTEPNSMMAKLHDRMPVIVQNANIDEWLDPENHDIAELQDLLVAAPDDLLTEYTVGKRVNSVQQNGPDLIEPK